MRHVLLLMAFSLVGCATVQRPNIEAMIVNAPGKKRCGYNLLNDYDDDGRIKPGAKMICRPNASVKDLNKAFLIDSEEGFTAAIAKLKAYIKNLREEAERKCQ